MTKNSSKELVVYLKKVNKSLRRDAAGKISVGYNLWFIKEHKKDLGYSSFEALLEEEIGITRQTATTYINLCKNFSELDADGNPTEKLKEEYTGMKIGKLVELMNSNNVKTAAETIVADKPTATEDAIETEAGTSAIRTSRKENIKPIDGKYMTWQELADYCTAPSETIEEGWHIELQLVRNE